ncbi:MAG: type II toxin-antitoxin system HicB family antitoxin [Euryarchaeota archaeon]|nr:type II toxin-antitoxin system HicB family antitoxin [Euryarchaeota archaeon]MDE1836795.1 type II toxin-antitoxin system HicB family antitoxin [Euryarchaeota archaeon]MDE1881112.1 type II toxin-antitoxin system HicB family antitoxin [Euryarchaeota archaeon]MDE2044779.1 type II toxin-antitoxin system HicB family antitoxin [Thermoplasmata archaeon]
MRSGFTVKVYKAEEGGYWAEVPELPGCVTQAENLSGIRKNIADAIEGYLEVLAQQAHPRKPSEAGRAVRTFRVELAAV